jgi:peptide/nickel transport system ATP-binding protein
MDKKLLEIKDLHVQYNTDDAVVHALNGFSLSVARGEVIGLVGETGAGKTTMALSILKLLPPKVGQVTGGSIVYNNWDILKANKKEMLELRGARVSMIFQDPMTSLNPIITVGEQIREVLDLHFPEMHKDEKEKRVDEILGLVGIQASRKGEYPYQFSGGMKQRIGIAMALVAEPELLLADEPTTALDVTIQAQILRLMKNLKLKFNTAMILITHNLGVVAKFCENVAVVYAGEVIERGSVEDVFSRRKNHPYTEGLFKSIPDLTTDAERLVPITGFMADPTNLPKGCKFAERCAYHTEQCTREEPPIFVEGAHEIKCFKYASEGRKET